MLEIFHINCVTIVSPIIDNVCGHCLLLKENEKLILVDTGIGLKDILNPLERIGQELIDIVGYQFNEDQTAIQQIKNLGLNPENVADCIISHFDNDHIGGLADFPNATVHVGIEEFENYVSGNPRYLKIQLAHNPKIKKYKNAYSDWFGFEARKVKTNIHSEIFLIPLFGHTLGHCGIAIKANNKWLFYIGDAYYLRAELFDNNHPVKELATINADNNVLRIDTLNKIRKLTNDHPEIEVFGYHDYEEFKNCKN